MTISPDRPRTVADIFEGLMPVGAVMVKVPVAVEKIREAEKLRTLEQEPMWKPAPSPLAFRPTPRQREVLILLAQGFSHDQIARRLFMAPNTVRHHSKRLRKEVGAVNTTHLISIAHQKGWI